MIGGDSIGFLALQGLRIHAQAPYGLPQGSILGSLLYIIYTSGIASLLASHAMLAQLYADDVHDYQHCLASDALVTVSAISRTMEALGSWMMSSRLHLNSHLLLCVSPPSALTRLLNDFFFLFWSLPNPGSFLFFLLQVLPNIVHPDFVL